MSSVRIDTGQKMKFSIKDFFSKCDQIRSFLRIWSHLPKKYLMENLFFVQCEKEFCNPSREYCQTISLSIVLVES